MSFESSAKRNLAKTAAVDTKASFKKDVGGKKAAVQPEFRAHVEEKLFQCCRKNASFNTGITGAAAKTSR